MTIKNLKKLFWNKVNSKVLSDTDLVELLKDWSWVNLKLSILVVERKDWVLKNCYSKINDFNTPSKLSIPIDIECWELFLVFDQIRSFEKRDFNSFGVNFIDDGFDGKIYKDLAIYLAKVLPTDESEHSLSVFLIKNFFRLGNIYQVKKYIKYDSSIEFIRGLNLSPQDCESARINILNYFTNKLTMKIDENDRNLNSYLDSDEYIKNKFQKLETLFIDFSKSKDSKLVRKNKLWEMDVSEETLVINEFVEMLTDFLSLPIKNILNVIFNTRKKEILKHLETPEILVIPNNLSSKKDTTFNNKNLQEYLDQNIKQLDYLRSSKRKAAKELSDLETEVLDYLHRFIFRYNFQDKFTPISTKLSLIGDILKTLNISYRHINLDGYGIGLIVFLSNNEVVLIGKEYRFVLMLSGKNIKLDVNSTIEGLNFLILKKIEKTFSFYISLKDELFKEVLIFNNNTEGGFYSGLIERSKFFKIQDGSRFIYEKFIFDSLRYSSNFLLRDFCENLKYSNRVLLGYLSKIGIYLHPDTKEYLFNLNWFYTNMNDKSEVLKNCLTKFGFDFFVLYNYSWTQLINRNHKDSLKAMLSILGFLKENKFPIPIIVSLNIVENLFFLSKYRDLFKYYETYILNSSKDIIPSKEVNNISINIDYFYIQSYDERLQKIKILYSLSEYNLGSFKSAEETIRLVLKENPELIDYIFSEILNNILNIDEDLNSDKISNVLKLLKKVY